MLPRVPFRTNLLAHTKKLLKLLFTHRRRLAFFLVLPPLLLLLLSSPTPSLRALTTALSASPSVSTWSPPACAGAFLSGPSAHSQTSFPEIAVRDIVRDTRPASARDFALLHPAAATRSLRVVLYISAHLSVRLLSAAQATSRAPRHRPSLPGTAAATAAIAIDHVLPVNDFVLRPGAYTPGVTTKYGDEVSEWQVIVSIYGAGGEEEQEFGAVVRDAWGQAGLAFVPIAFRRFDAPPGEVAIFNATFSADCLFGWDDTSPFPLLASARRPSCASARGAVALGGSPLHGAKARDPVKVREVAHFCARSLLGPVAFDLVALPVVPRTSLSEVASRCGADAECARREHGANAQFLRSIAEAVEEELFLLDVAPHFFSRVILVPICRLGSNFRGAEEGWPCRSSFWSGQYISSYLMFNLVGTAFRWSASYDLDEFLAPAAGGGGDAMTATRAENLFDALNRRGRNSLKFTWLNFRVKDAHLARPLTRSLIAAHSPALQNPATGAVSECYAWPTGVGNNGKTALRCDSGVGFTIHAAVQMLPGKLLNQTVRPTYLASKKTRLWHPRLEGSLGKCDFEPERL